VDVVLMDLNLPVLPGVEATARITAMPDPPAVLVLTMVDDDDTVVAALRAGARGYVLKGSTGEEIAAAVRTVAAGGAVFGPGVAARVLAATSTAVVRADPAEDDGLTGREREVLAQIAQGKSNSAIAESLVLTKRAVEKHINSIFSKLNLSDAEQASKRVKAALAFLSEEPVAGD